jgi:hypothetical protein
MTKPKDDPEVGPFDIATKELAKLLRAARHNCSGKEQAISQLMKELADFEQQAQGYERAIRALGGQMPADFNEYPLSGKGERMEKP